MSFLRELGTSGIQVSALGLGTVKIGRNQGVKYPTGFELPDDEAVGALLHEAKALGINLIDTAPAYGTSEVRLGRLLPDRHNWVIVTKAGEEFENGESRFDFSARHIRHSVERSLQRLNTDYLDCVLLHSDGNDMALLQQTDALETLMRVKEKGWVRSVGLSGKTVEGGLEALRLGVDTCMVTYNLKQQEELPVIEAAHREGRGIFIKKAFASGHLAEDITDPVTASLALSINTKGVSSIIVGTLDPWHLTENVVKAKTILDHHHP
jgi:aryl-alcohol dehydrogenase-like predicted oxidoreductase